MKRFKVLLGQRRFQVLATMAVLLLAVSIVYASGANFTATSANPSNTFTAGIMSLGNSKTTSGVEHAVLTAANMVPDDDALGSVVITNTGNAGVITLSSSNLSLAAGPRGGILAGTLELTIVEKDSLGTVISTPYNGVKLNALAPVTLSAFAQGEARTYEFTVHFPDTDKGSSPATNGSDNAYQGAATSVQFDWTAVSD